MQVDTLYNVGDIVYVVLPRPSQVPGTVVKERAERGQTIWDGQGPQPEVEGGVVRVSYTVEFAGRFVQIEEGRLSYTQP